jgi:creatinine amidohydrolase
MGKFIVGVIVTLLVLILGGLGFAMLGFFPTPANVEPPRWERHFAMGAVDAFTERSMSAAANSPPIKCRLRNWWQNQEVRKLSKELYGDAEGSHATPSEVAVTQFAYPDAIKSAPLDPPVAPSGDFADAADYRRNFPDGRIGSNPALASPEAGRRLYEAAVAALTKDYLDWIASG